MSTFDGSRLIDLVVPPWYHLWASAPNPAILRGDRWQDRDAATTSVLRYKWRWHVAGKLRQGAITLGVFEEWPRVRGIDGFYGDAAYIDNKTAVDIYLLGYDMLRSFGCSGSAFDEALEQALARQMDMLKGLAEKKGKMDGEEERFVASLWKPASVQWMVMILTDVRAASSRS